MREYEIDEMPNGDLYVWEKPEGGADWICRVRTMTLDGLSYTLSAVVPRDMPAPARAALRRWLADRIIMMECGL